jgi:hypothetical protein
MNPTFEKILTHDESDDCPVCRAQDIVAFSLVPAVKRLTRCRSS